MNGNTIGFVYDQQIIILEQDGEFTGGSGAFASLRLRDAHWRDSQLVSSFEPRISLHSLLVHPHLTIADDPVDVTLGHTFAAPDQEVVNTLTCPFL
jgi:hypothetical protein